MTEVSFFLAFFPPLFLGLEVWIGDGTSTVYDENLVLIMTLNLVRLKINKKQTNKQRGKGKNIV